MNGRCEICYSELIYEDGIILCPNCSADEEFEISEEAEEEAEEEETKPTRE